MYYAKCFDRDVDHAVEILADIVQNSLLGRVRVHTCFCEFYFETLAPFTIKN